LAFTLHDQRLVLLTTHHLLFGDKGHEDEPVWIANDEGCSRLGQSLYGRSRVVHLDGEEYYVDCAVGSVAAATNATAAEYDIARPGDRVINTGAATGTTAGVVADISYSRSVIINGRKQPAPRQLLIRSADDRPFAAEGDSGAIIVNSHNEAVGLLWGVNVRGDGIACHMHAVMRTLNITLAAAHA
jgi:hypothetical protein